MIKRFKPQYLPYNDDAHSMVEALAVELELTLKNSTGAKHKTILASFIYCVQEAGIGAYLDWSGGTTSQDTTGFSFFPATGSSTVVKVRTKLVEAGYVILAADLLAQTELKRATYRVLGTAIPNDQNRMTYDTVQGTYQFNDVPYTLGTMSKHEETYPNDETSRHKQNLEAFKAWKLKEGYED